MPGACGGPQRKYPEAFMLTNDPREPIPGEWIPCKERLPEKSGNYIVSGIWSSGKKAVGECEYSTDDGYFQASWNFTVLAWMPLPEPYKEEE